jgi:hypothetical protein
MTPRCYHHRKAQPDVTATGTVAVPIGGGAVHCAGHDLSSRRYRASVAHLAHLHAPFDRNLSRGKAERATRAEPVTCSHAKRANGSFQ